MIWYNQDTPLRTDQVRVIENDTAVLGQVGT
jgi:hypothetical protein